MIKFLEFLVLGYLIYIFLRNVFGRFFITQPKHGAQSTFREYKTSSNNRQDYRSYESSGKNYGATRVDHVPQEETKNSVNDDGEYIDYKEVK